MKDPVDHYLSPFCQDAKHLCRNLSLILTAQRDHRSLIDCVGTFLINVQIADSVAIFEPLTFDSIESESQRRLSRVYPTLGERSLLATQEQGLVECLTQGLPVEVAEGNGSRYVQPILLGSRISQLVVLDGFAATAENREFVADLADLVGNLNVLHQRSERDGLTNLLNRQVFDRELSALLGEVVHPNRRDRASGVGHFLGLVDVDHFKRINDQHGHIYGDEVLLSLAQLMQRSFRARDRLFRYGGEEFAILLSDLTEPQANGAFDRLRRAVMANLFPQIGGVTVSIGFVRLEPSPPSRLIERADKALYFAKNHGRNRVESYASLLASGHLSEPAVSSDIELF